MDIDGDGRRDILSGSYSRMTNDMAGLFQVLYGKADGTFRKAEVLKGTDGEPLIIPVKSKPGQGEDWVNNICTRPFAVDWDGDGHLDLVVGTFPGKFYLFKGQGSGKFLPKPEEMKAGDQPLNFRGPSRRPVRDRLGRRRRPRHPERIERGRRAMGREPRRDREAAPPGALPLDHPARPADDYGRSSATRISRGR